METNTKIAIIATTVIVTALPAVAFIRSGRKMLANVEKKRNPIKVVATLANTLTN